MIVLDTHVWIWWVNDDRIRLRPSWILAIETADKVGVAAISCFEIAWLVRNTRITVPCPLRQWFPLALSGSDIEVLALSPSVAQLAVELPLHHRDPHDRLILATAIEHDAHLISADRNFEAYEQVRDRLIP